MFCIFLHKMYVATRIKICEPFTRLTHVIRHRCVAEWSSSSRNGCEIRQQTIRQTKWGNDKKISQGAQNLRFRFVIISYSLFCIRFANVFGKSDESKYCRHTRILFVQNLMTQRVCVYDLESIIFHFRISD